MPGNRVFLRAVFLHKFGSERKREVRASMRLEEFLSSVDRTILGVVVCLWQSKYVGCPLGHCFCGVCKFGTQL